MAIDPGGASGGVPVPLTGGVWSLADVQAYYPDAVDKYGRTAATLIAALTAWVTAENLTNVYRVRLHGDYAGRPVSTILYYQAYGLDSGSVAWGGSDDLAYQINQEVIPALRAASPAALTWLSMTVDAVDGLFARLFTDPLQYTISNGQGTRGGTLVDQDDHGFAWHLEATLAPFPLTFSDIFGLTPRSGRIYLPGVFSGDIAGNRIANIPGAVDALAGVLASNLENAVPPVVYVPARTRIIRMTIPALGRSIRVWGASARVSSWQVMPRIVHLDKRS